MRTCAPVPIHISNLGHSMTGRPKNSQNNTLYLRFQ